MDTLLFKDKDGFYQWLDENHETSAGVWLTFDKTRQTSTMTQAEAVRVALTFGWIDGHMKRIDDQYFVKYFTRRLKTSIWSTINKRTALELIEKGLMKPLGMEAVRLAQTDGRWERADQPPADFDLDKFSDLIRTDPLAYQNYHAFSPSIRKTYALSYYTLKKEDSRKRRLEVIIRRLKLKLKPM